MRARTTALVAAATALAIILSGCSATKVPFVEETFSALAEYEQQKLDWSSCYE
jgi:hypothetical protein